MRPIRFVAAALFLPLPAAAQLHSWTVPGVVRAPGKNGTSYVSDLVATNPGKTPAALFLSFVPSTTSSLPPQFLLPGQSLSVTDAVASLLGVDQAVGALEILSDQPLVLRGRTYNTAASGTFGVSLPVVPDEELLFPGDGADSLWLSQSADAATGYRTNVALVFPDPDGGDATVTVYDASGARVGQRLFTSAAAGFVQLPLDAFSPPLDAGRARVDVTRGRAAGYAVVVDNVTGDGSVFPFEPLPAGPQDAVVNGVARAGGQKGTFWRTDARLYNPTRADVPVTLAFLGAANANPSPAQAVVTVPAGKILDLPDVLSALFQLPVGSAGALRVTAGDPVALLCRTSNVDPSGSRPGTFGSQERSVPLPSFLSSVDAGGLVTGLRQGAATRTNVGFAAGEGGAAYTLTLKDPSGTPIGSASGSLGPFGWTQPGLADLFPGVPVPDGTQLLVKVSSGTLDVFDSSIDNGSGDPVVTPVAPLPAAVPSSATIGPAGGIVGSDDGRLTLRIPAGALASPMPVTIAAVADTAPLATGPSYAISPGDLALSKPALLTFHYGADDVSGSDPAWLAPAFLAAGVWSSVPSWSIDTGRRNVYSALASPAPSAARTARAAPLAAGGPVVYQLVRQLVLQGDAVVNPGTGTRYAVKALSRLVRGTSSPLQLDGSLAGASYAWSVDFSPGGNSTVGTIEPDVPPDEAVYTAPYCPPSEGWVAVSAVVSRPGAPDALASKAVSIFPTSWTLAFDETEKLSCSLGAAQTAAYSVHDRAEQDFDVDWTTGNLRERELRLVQPDFTTPLTGCGTEAGCTLTALDAPSGLTIHTLTGKVRAGRLGFSMTYDHIGTPPIRVQCPTYPPVDHGARPGAPDRSESPFRIGPKGTTYESGSGGFGYDYVYVWDVRPRPPLACP